jgi:ABC-type ATPase involved in cell division
MAATPKPILEFDQATVESGHAYDTGLFDVNLALAAGELALVRLEREAFRLPLGDAACGTAELENGVARFLGEDWRRMSFREAIRCRGLIGRHFDGHAWVNSLTVDENVMLAQRYHTRRSDKEIIEEASRLARQFGLPGLPKGRPMQTRRQDLHRAGLVRAFLGMAELLILERPENDLFPQIMPALMNAAQSARRRGAAILWLTDKVEVWRDAAVRPTRRFAVSGSQVLLMDDEGAAVQ